MRVIVGRRARETRAIESPWLGGVTGRRERVHERVGSQRLEGPSPKCKLKQKFEICTNLFHCFNYLGVALH